MSKYIIDSETLTDIADSIRTKTGKTATMTPVEMPDEIESISGGVTVEALSVTANGTYTAPSGKAYSPVTVSVSGDYFYIEGIEAGTIRFTATGTVDVELQYSTDTTNWTDYTLGTDINIAVGQKIYWRNNNYQLSVNTNNYVTIESSNKFNAGGRISSLINDDGCYSYAFIHLFQSSPVVDASNLKLHKRVASNCYVEMFHYCTELIAAPALPATMVLGYSYQHMFRGCTALTTPPALPATTIGNYCYSNMFNGCTSLTTAPSLPATVLAEQCYSGMFRGCTALTTVPNLPATVLQNSCYTVMFEGCSALKVFSTSGEGHDKVWKIPTNDTIRNPSTSQNNMFNGVYTDNVPATFTATQGQQYTYYTQNEPV